jgi:tetratricopeptide (TPR) repeat protein
MDDYRRALLYLPLDDELHRRYASMAYYVKQLDIARENIRRAAVLDPVNPQTQSWLDRISHIPPDQVDASNAVTQALETDRLEDALQAADVALSAAPESAELLSLKGQILARQGNFEVARASLEQAAKSAPLLADPHEWLGYLGLKGENWDVCVREYSEAIERDPGLENAICKRGYCYSRLNEDDRAGEDITSACQMGDETCCQVLSKHSDRGWLKLILPAIALGGVLMLYRLRKRARARLA